MRLSTAGAFGKQARGHTYGVGSTARAETVRDVSFRCFRPREFLSITPCGYGGK